MRPRFPAFFSFRPSLFSLPLPGFLPVIVTWLQSKRSSSVVQLPEDDVQSEDDQDPSSAAAKDFPDAGPIPLHGWNYFLFWLPAACDLTGTTVRTLLPHLPSFIDTNKPQTQSSTRFVPLGFFSLTSFANTCSNSAHECRTLVYSRINLPNDSWRPRSLRRRLQRPLPSPSLMALPVEYPINSVPDRLDSEYSQMGIIDHRHGWGLFGRL